ncbi:phage tail sheath protein [soil metagenome]
MHGISVTEVTRQNRNIATIATAVIGLVASGPAADAAKFPLDKPVLLTNLPAALALAGDTGTLKLALEAIADQVRCPVIVVRIAPGADDDATALKVIGTDVAGVKTGMQALLAAEAQTGLRPRIIGAPGLDAGPIKTQLAIVARKLRAMAYGRADGATIAEVTDGRDDFDQRELMLIHPDFLSPVGVLGATGTSFAVARALGMRARIDQEMGWNKTLSNVPVSGVVGLTSDVGFDLQDPDSDANQLNAAHVTTIVRINGALRFWGNRTCAPAESDFLFESATRTAQILADTMANGLIEYIDKPLTPSLARDIVEDINEKFRKLTRAGYLLGARAYFDPDKNPVDDLKLGKLKISYVYTPTPPLEDLGLLQEISDEYLADFAQLVAGA